VEGTAVSRPIPSTLNETNAKASNAILGEPSALSSDAEINAVEVRPGETLREIIRRTIGKDSGEIVDRVRKLNPEIADLNHIEVGQQIRLPRPSVPIVSEGTNAEVNIIGKN
jgi:hypothetical protein